MYGGSKFGEAGHGAEGGKSGGFSLGVRHSDEVCVGQQLVEQLHARRLIAGDQRLALALLPAVAVCRRRRPLQPK